MHAVLVEIPALSVWVWMALLAGFFGLFGYWGVRDALAEGGPPAEQRRRAMAAALTNVALFAAGALLLWWLRDRVARPVPVRSYGVMLMVAFGAGLLWLRRVSRGTALGPDRAVDLMLGLLVTGVLAARLLFVLLNWGDYTGNWRHLFRVWEGGLSFHGGLAGGVLWVVYYARRQRLGFWWLADLMVPGLALGYAIARIGCFLNGCCYGTPTDLPWAVRFRDPLASDRLTVPSHPAQIYATLINLSIFAALNWFLGRKRHDGEVLGLYLVLYSAYRFGIEALRKGATGQVLALGLTQAQWASLAIAVGGALLFANMRRHGSRAKHEAVAVPSQAAEGAAPRAARSGSRRSQRKARADRRR